MLTTFTVGPFGNFTIDRVLSQGNCGFYLQAVDLVGCQTTNVEQVPLE